MRNFRFGHKFKKTAFYVDLDFGDFSWLAFSYLGSKDYRIWMFFFLWWQLDIYFAYNDRFIEDVDKSGRKCYTKNPKYANEKTRVISIPPIGNRITFTYGGKEDK